MPAWFAVKQSKAVFLLTLNDGFNYMKHFQNCLHHTSDPPQPFLLLIAANLALAGFLAENGALWSVPTWLVVQPSRDFLFLTLYDSINDKKYF